MTNPVQTSCAICGAPVPGGAAQSAACPTCGTAVSPGGAVGGVDMFAPAPPKREPPPPPTTQERLIAIAKASGFWGVLGLVAGAIPLSILGAVMNFEFLNTLEPSRRMMVVGGFGATLGSLLGITWGAVRIEELSTPKAIGFGIIVGIPLSALYRFFLFPSDLMPESGVFDSIVMGVFGGVMCGAIVSWLNRDY